MSPKSPMMTQRCQKFGEGEGSVGCKRGQRARIKIEEAGQRRRQSKKEVKEEAAEERRGKDLTARAEREKPKGETETGDPHMFPCVVLLLSWENAEREGAGKWGVGGG